MERARLSEIHYSADFPSLQIQLGSVKASNTQIIYLPPPLPPLAEQLGEATSKETQFQVAQTQPQRKPRGRLQDPIYLGGAALIILVGLLGIGSLSFSYICFREPQLLDLSQHALKAFGGLGFGVSALVGTSLVANTAYQLKQGQAEQQKARREHLEQFVDVTAQLMAE